VTAAQVHTLSTQAGPVELSWSVEGGDELLLADSQRISRGVVETWRRPGELEVTLTIAHIDPPLSDQWLPLDGCVGAVWTFQALRPHGPIDIEGRYLALDADLGGSDCGELLTAVTFEQGGRTLSIGTHDNDALARRALDLPHAFGPALPPEWAPDLPEPWEGGSEYGSTVVGAGVRLRLPRLPAGGRADLHVAVAWGATRDDAATWYAVDTEPTRILTEARRRT